MPNTELELFEKQQRETAILRTAARKIRENILADKTPKEYIKTKPGGNYFYVPAPFMDSKFKEHIPLYSGKFAFPPIIWKNWIVVGVELKDESTGNTEMGLKAHRIQIGKELRRAITGYFDEQNNWVAPTKTPEDITPFDIVDMSNDVAAALTDSIKNAQSRFGICADVYDKIVMTEADIKEMEDEFLSILMTISNPLLKKKYASEWKSYNNVTDKFTYLQNLKEGLQVDVTNRPQSQT